MADTIEGKTRSEILALYDMQSGEMVYSCKLGMDVKYNIHDINI